MTPFLFSPFNMIRLFSLTPITTQKTEKPIRGSLQVSSTNESGVRALAFLHTQVLLGTCRQREESPANALPYCFSVFCFWVLHCLLSIIGRFQKKERRKVEFPDVSSFLCPSPYRGCGGWQFRNRIHHLMRSFHPSDTNIAEGSIFRPPGRKIFLEIFSDLSSGLRPAPFWGRSLRYILCCEANRVGGAWRQEISRLRFAALEMTVRHVPQCYNLHKGKKQPHTKLLFCPKETRCLSIPYGQ